MKAQVKAKLLSALHFYLSAANYMLNPLQETATDWVRIQTSLTCLLQQWQVLAALDNHGLFFPLALPCSWTAVLHPKPWNM